MAGKEKVVKKKVGAYYSVGADPEVFVADSWTGAVVPVCGLLGGTKKEPLAIEGYADYAVQEDNVMAEFNIPPCYGQEDFSHAISTGLDLVEQRIVESNPRYHLDRTACSRQFSNLMLSQYPQALAFGCDPDYNAYSMGKECAPIDPSLLIDGDASWRFAGGHVHVGYKEAWMENKFSLPEFVLAAWMDYALALPLVDGDRQGMRRRLYGTPGRYRPKPYGIEYRVLSNKWIFNPKLREWVFYYTHNLVRKLPQYDMDSIRSWYKIVPWQDVQRAIETEDMKLATDVRNYAQQRGVPF